MDAPLPPTPTPTPPADNPGGTGAQTSGPKDIAEYIPRTKFEGVVDALKGLAEIKPRSMGGEAIATLMAGIVTTLQDEANAARDGLNKKAEQVDKIRDELSAASALNGVLAEKIASFGKAQTLTQVMLTSASILIGVSVDAFKSGTHSLAIVTGLTALGLLVSGWMVPRTKGSPNV
ncbi:hypothetical protein [Xanthomonas nasturtii]|uniref:DUF2335 domain-containing protein n=1 Tax=Xanthomonas nasturtii TaxID=1843581 RepID=A0ABT0LT34_9XANT|nr:hypothetical protein [Xanthomonas nasturtii]MCL1552496.1 hypothetical protein [Xanthomonas nasturtii]MCL1555466.1 hypothetical protein [Xanthomonas nasturtii]